MAKYQAGMRISEYLLEECIGAGSFGEVWRARHHIWGADQVAVKLPTQPEYVRYLQREGIVIHGLKHDNIIRVMGFDPYAEQPYLVMELVRGPSLKQLLDQNRKGLPVDACLTILRGVLRAMEAAHSANVMHRDLKPGNILLNLGDRGLDDLRPADVKIGDFGLGVSNADTLRSIAHSGSLDRDDKLVGTLAYMAPELRDGQQKPSPRSDLYSIGVILFEMLTGERPAGAELPSGLRPEIPSALDEVYRRLYARHDSRYESARAVLDDFETRLAVQRQHRDGRVVPPPPPPADWEHQSAGRGALRACSACNHLVAADDQFCTYCGHQLTAAVRRCPACRGYPAPRDRFCIFCGAALPPEE